MLFYAHVILIIHIYNNIIQYNTHLSYTIHIYYTYADKYVGEAEKNIRDLFKEADYEWETLGIAYILYVLHITLLNTYITIQ